MPGKTSAETVYRICAVLGTLFVVITPWLSWQYVLDLEKNASGLFEERILARLDLKSLKDQFKSLKTTIETGRGDADSAESVDYTAAQMRHLLSDSEALNRQIEKTLSKLKRLETAKDKLTLHIKLLFAATAIGTAIGMVVAVFGFIGWYFHLRIFAERRAAPRP